MFPSATDECIRCYRLRDLLSLVGGYVFVGAVIIYSTILPPCFSGSGFSLRLTLSRGQPCAILARNAGRKQKRPVLLHTGYGEKYKKANGTCSLKNVISVPFMYKSTSLKTSWTLCFAYRKTGLTQLPAALIIIFCLYKIKPNRLYS